MYLFMCEAELLRRTLEWLHSEPDESVSVYEKLAPCEVVYDAEKERTSKETL